MTSFVKNTIVITAGLSRSPSRLRHPPTQVTSTATFLFECLKLSQTELNPDVEFVKCLTRAGLRNPLQPCSRAARKWREIHSLLFLILSLFPPSLSISYIKICHILSQNVKYGTFVSKVTKILTYTLRK